MASGVVVVLVKVQDTMDMQIVKARPCHEHGDDIGCFLGIVDVIHEITKAVNDDKAIAGTFSQGIVDKAESEAWRVFTQSDKGYHVAVYVYWLARQLQDSSENLMAMVSALFGVKVENLPFPLWHGCLVVQDGSVLDGCRYHGRHIKGFLALRLTRRCAEVTEGGNGTVTNPQYLGWHFGLL